MRNGSQIFFSTDCSSRTERKNEPANVWKKRSTIANVTASIISRTVTPDGTPTNRYYLGYDLYMLTAADSENNLPVFPFSSLPRNPRHITTNTFHKHKERSIIVHVNHPLNPVQCLPDFLSLPLISTKHVMYHHLNTCSVNVRIGCCSCCYS